MLSYSIIGLMTNFDVCVTDGQKHNKGKIH